jgi:hypothetical protein
MKRSEPGSVQTDGENTASPDILLKTPKNVTSIEDLGLLFVSIAGAELSTPVRG